MLAQVIEDDRQQRASTILQDVEYVIDGHYVVRNNSESPQKHYEMFKRRATKGQCFQRPYLGCREFVADFQWHEGEVIATVSESLGWSSRSGIHAARHRFRRTTCRRVFSAAPWLTASSMFHRYEAQRFAHDCATIVRVLRPHRGRPAHRKLRIEWDSHLQQSQLLRSSSTHEGALFRHHRTFASTDGKKQTAIMMRMSLPYLGTRAVVRKSQAMFLWDQAEISCSGGFPER
jgi:hypothetical protein